MRVKVTLAAALALLAIAIGVTLSGSPMVAIGANSNVAKESLAEAEHGAGACQSGEVLPAGTSMIRLTLRSVAGAQVSVEAWSGGRMLTNGVVGSGWTGGSVAVPVRPVARTTANTRICFRLGPTREKVAIVGERTKPTMAARSREGKALPGRIKVEYVRAGADSWWPIMPMVARRLGLGRAPSGTWIALALIGLMAVAVAGASWLALRELQ